MDSFFFIVRATGRARLTSRHAIAMWAEREKGFSYKTNSHKRNIRQKLTYSSWSKNDLGSVGSQARKSKSREKSRLWFPRDSSATWQVWQADRGGVQAKGEGGLDLGRSGGYWSQRSGSSGVAGPHLKDEGYIPSPRSTGVSLSISLFIYLPFSRVLSMITGRAGEKRK